jgi:V/A-type H+/Na+-transporting ATPase subunit E
MAEELQHLIERIQKEAIDKAEDEAERIVRSAREKASQLVKSAEAEAKARLEKADRDAQVYVERSRTTLEQAARDLLITVGQGIENILEDLVGESVDEAMDIELLKQMMLKIAQAYCEHRSGESRIEFLISEQDQQDLVKFFAEQYREHLVRGINIHTDNGILKGFRVSLVDEQVYHDFTRPAMAEALSQFLRKHLAEIVHRAAADTSSDENGDRPSGAGSQEKKAES